MITIRTAAPSDTQAIARVHQDAIRALAGSHYSQAQLDAWAAIHSPAYYERVLSAYQEVLVAEQDGRIVAAGRLDLESGNMQSVYVAPEAAGHGVGSALLEHMEALARMHGWPMVHLVASLNAVPFFEKRGYAKVSKLHHELASGVALDLVQMRKRFPKS